MLNLLLLVLLIQDRPIEASVEAFLKGEESAKTELLKLGALAIRPLQSARDRNPAKVDAFLRDLKKAAAYPTGLIPRAGFNGVLTLRDQEIEGMMPTLQSLEIPIHLDGVDLKKLKSTRFTVEKLTDAQAILEEICRQTGLDYGYFHNAIVLSTPERLWPSGPPPKPSDLPAESLVRARELYAKLASDLIDEREEASRQLAALGPPVTSFLEARLSDATGEVAQRCRAIIERLKPVARSAFGPAAVLRQVHLDSADWRILKKIEEKRASLKFTEGSLADAVKFFEVVSEIPFPVSPAMECHLPPIRTSDRRLMDHLSLITQMNNLDFVIQDSKVVIDTREAIEKRLREHKK